MGRKTALILFGAFVAVVVTIIATITFAHDVPVLNPQGTIADKQRDLIIVATLLMLIVVIPVYVLTFAFAWRYRAGNTKAKYSPNLKGNSWLEAIWWGVPLLIIIVLAIITWKTSHELDPFKPLDSKTEAVEVQVVALQWKWLFIYPDYNIASLNYVRIPEKTPINFTLTSDAPMNSFWIPSLGSQIYAMSGMSTKVHLMANEKGVYRGSSANISGEGFSRMTFKAESTSQRDFIDWTRKVGMSDTRLDDASYTKLMKPGIVKDSRTYGSVQKDLYDTVVMKYMVPQGVDNE